ncbi:MAG: TolC family protein [Chromatiales bacterium]
MPSAAAAEGGVLALSEAEALALEKDPLIHGYQSQSDAFVERAVAEGQLPDPQLQFGIQDLPTDTFSFTQDDFTMLVVGAQQAFPRGRTLRYASERMQAMSDAEAAKAAHQRLLVVQAVRNAYLELHYQNHAEAILRENRSLFEELLSITEKQYAAGRDNQHDVIRAQLELSLLDDRLTETASDREQALAELAKWIAPAQAQRPLSEELPSLAALPAKEALATNLPKHPAIQAENAMVNASEKSVAIAGEQYKPGWMLDISYGYRDQDFTGTDLTDFFSAMVTMDLPLFPGKRQDRALAASEKEVTAATYNRAEKLRELTRVLEAVYAKYERLGERFDLYEKRARVEAAQTTEATLAAYETGRADFISMLRARMTDIDTQLMALRIQVDRAKAQADLLYLAGETP